MSGLPAADDDDDALLCGTDDCFATLRGRIPKKRLSAKISGSGFRKS